MRHLVLLAMLAMPAHAEAMTDAEFQTLAEDAFGPIIEEYAIPGLAIGVTVDGRQHFYTHGLAVRDGAIPVTPDTIFELGSISKLFNVALAGVAEQDGTLSLNDPVSARLPALKGSAFDRITLGDLAAHATGGLPLQVPDDIKDNDALMRYLAEWSPADTSIRAYSNVSIGLLGLIVGEGAYEAAVSDRLLIPLGLNSTFVTVPEAAMPRYAFGYSKTDDSPIRVTPGMLDAEAYGLKSSITDMTRFLGAQLGHVDLEPKIVAALARTRMAEFDTAHFAQAMIWESYPWPVEPEQLAAGNSSDMALKPQPMTRRKASELDGFINKTGATNGFGAYVAMVPAEDIGIAVLANRNYPNAARAEATLKLMQDILGR